MVAKIDIDAPKLKKKNQEQMIPKIGKTLKKPVSTLVLLVLKKNSVLRLVYFWKNLKSIVAVNMNIYRPTTSRALTSFKKLRYGKSCSFFFTLIQKYN